MKWGLPIRPASETATEPARWSLAHRITARFWAIYLPLALFPDTTTFDLLLDPFRALVAKLFWGLSEIPSRESTGSGDRLFDWVSLVTVFLVAVLGTTAWSVLARRRPNERWTYETTRVLVRYGLALTLFSYGFAKLSQFPPLDHARMLVPLGGETAMGVLWNFMGASPAYAAVSGVLEVLGGLLLLFRRTTTLSALVVVPVMLNVFLLNLCYDVPVKLMSFHLFLAGLFLALPDFRRLFDVLILNRPTTPREITPPIRYPWLRAAGLLVKWLFFFGVLRDGVRMAADDVARLSRPAPSIAGI